VTLNFTQLKKTVRLCNTFLNSDVYIRY